jgi:hypothetical protein
MLAEHFQQRTLYLRLLNGQSMSQRREPCLFLPDTQKFT